MSNYLKDYIPKIILASASPARKQLLINAGIQVIVSPTDSDEDILTPISPGETVQMLSCRKMDNYLFSNDVKQTSILTCDTLVYFENIPYGKPNSRIQAFQMLKTYSGNHHFVYTGYCLIYKNKKFFGFDKATVYFKNLTDKQINDYLDTKEYENAAGSYRIQGRAAAFIDHIDGDIATVIGIPMKLLLKTVEIN
ncbi:MAG: Maf family protein [Sphaerochaetaceae bacterium]